MMTDNEAAFRDVEVLVCFSLNESMVMFGVGMCVCVCVVCDCGTRVDGAESSSAHLDVVLVNDPINVQS